MVDDIDKTFGLDSILPEQPGLNTAATSMLGLLEQGRSSFEEIVLLKHSVLFKRSFELPFIPAREALRLYLEKAALFPRSGRNDRFLDKWAHYTLLF